MGVSGPARVPRSRANHAAIRTVGTSSSFWGSNAGGASYAFGARITGIRLSMLAIDTLERTRVSQHSLRLTTGPSDSEVSLSGQQQLFMTCCIDEHQRTARPPSPTVTTTLKPRRAPIARREREARTSDQGTLGPTPHQGACRTSPFKSAEWLT